MNHTKKGKRVYLEQIIKKTIDVYVGGESELYHTLNLSSILGKMHEAPASATYKIQQDSIIENVENLEHHSVEEEDFVDMEGNDCDNEYTDSEDSDSQSSSSDGNFSENELEVGLNDKLKQLPSWFLERYKRCELPPSFMDIMVRRVYLCSPQIEDASQPQSHQISFPILQAILRLLTPENDEPLLCWTRVGSKAGILSLDPLPKQDTWPLMENLLQTPRNKLVDVIMQALQLCSDDKNENKERKWGFNSLPSDWRILALSLAYWMRYSPEKKVNERHLIAACFTAVVLRVIDERAGPPGKSYSNIRKEKKRQYTDLKKQQRNKEVEDLIKSEKQHSQPVTHDDFNTIQSKYEEVEDVSEVKEKSVKPSVKQLLSSISLGDCIAVSNSEGLISQMRQIDAGPKRRLALRPSSFSGSTVHAFAELQSVLLHVTHLNLLLGEPIAPSPLHSSFSGTLAYNAHYRTHNRSTASRKQLWRNLLGIPAPSLEGLLEEFYLCVLRLAWGKVEDKMIKKKKRVKKKVRNKMADASAPRESYTEDSENQKIYYDPGNKYSILNQIG
ncbi:hypothetical protein J437_LFUL010672 [Ladona fulva]|uniref:Uncharacterized protein n=1 Tax=Ladona fulva TaxID=123851 RepID=A0A8K0KE13_LADFU|nr:hypothetical protein J437_LFUL010672 [Ladona fulva]